MRADGARPHAARAPFYVDRRILKCAAFMARSEKVDEEVAWDARGFERQTSQNSRSGSKKKNVSGSVFSVISPGCVTFSAL